jgi:hypothetical protein
MKEATWEGAEGVEVSINCPTAVYQQYPGEMFEGDSVNICIHPHASQTSFHYMMHLGGRGFGEYSTDVPVWARYRSVYYSDLRNSAPVYRMSVRQDLRIDSIYYSGGSLN